MIGGKGREHHRHSPSRLRGARGELAKRQVDLIFGLWALGFSLWAMGYRLRAQVRKRQEIQYTNRAGRGLRAVVVLFQPQQHGFVLACRTEPTAFDRIPEQRILLRLQRMRPFEPLRVAVGLKQLQQTEDEIGIVLGIAFNAGLSLAVSSQETAAGRIPQLLAHELRGAPGIIQEAGTVVQDAPGARKGGNHQPVPRRQHLVIQMRTRSRGSTSAQRFSTPPQ